MKRHTELRRVLSAFWLRVYKNGPTRFKIKYFLAMNHLYTSKKLKISEESNKTIEKIGQSIRVNWIFRKNTFGDKLLVLTLNKTGSKKLDETLNEYRDSLELIFNSDVLEVREDRNSVSYILIVKSAKKREVVIREHNIQSGTDSIDLDNFSDWKYKNNAHMLISGQTGSGKSYLMYYLISEMQKLTSKEHIIVCDPKASELYDIAKNKLCIKNTYETADDISFAVKNIVDKMNEIYQNKEENKEPYFLIIDEYAALQLQLDKKSFLDLQNNMKLLALKARAANIHLVLALQQPNAIDLPTALRDQFSIRIGLGNLQAITFKEMFGFEKKNVGIRKLGEGYISFGQTDINGLRSLKLPTIIKS